MALGNIAFAYMGHGQGNDDTRVDSSSSHLNTIEEIEAVANLLKYNGEFGERMISYVQYEGAPKAIAAFTAGETTAKRGRLDFVILFESAVAGQNGVKEYLTIEDFIEDDTLITAIKDFLIVQPAGSWVGINQKVASVNYTFTPRKS